ncbi:helix-turn-helix domain-containing protein [Kribbella sp. NPDC050124]|uniref:helix-turn-helix domain-containing protein n=1 Tax=Kribbella sp. NPDC050124 TaxID=3364114 RepID=UPI0037B8B819
MTRHSRQRELGAFLRERRARLTPAAAGLLEGPARRTPGLRREEVANLAGVSVGYYTRLEQGHASHPSDSVLNALTRTLQLTPDEASHLNALVTSGRPEMAVEQVSPSALRMIGLLASPSAAVVLGRTGDVLAWNGAAEYLFPGRFGGEWPNNARYVFGDRRARGLFVEWELVADETVAQLRSAAGHLVEDPAYRELVDELVESSAEFAERWSRREVRRHVSGEKRLNHPELGRISVDYEVVAVLDTPDQYLVVYGLKKSQLGDVEISRAVSTPW